MLTDMLVKGKENKKSIKSFLGRLQCQQCSLVDYENSMLCSDSQPEKKKKTFSNIKLCRTTGERMVPRGDVGHHSGKERNKFHRIMANTMEARLYIDLSQKVL